MKDWALILGASSGIGEACAHALAQQGMNIYGVYLRKPKDHVKKITEKLKQYNVKVIYKKANASNTDSRKEIISELLRFNNIRIKIFVHSIAFGVLKKMIATEASALNKKNIEMTQEVMCNNLIYWAQDLFNHNLLDGLSDKAPFSLIIIDGPIFKITDKLKNQLAMNGGRLIYIKKIYDNLGKAYKIIRNEDLYSSEYLFDVMSSYQIQEQQEDFKF